MVEKMRRKVMLEGSMQQDDDCKFERRLKTVDGDGAEKC